MRYAHAPAQSAELLRLVLLPELISEVSISIGVATPRPGESVEHTIDRATARV